MAIIKCKMCGGDIEISPDKTFGTCDYCGSVMTLPKVDDEQRAAAFNRGNHFRRIGEFDKALAVYERIVAEDDNDAEAHWCCALCRFGIEYVEDPATMEYVPTCHRASFDSFLEDVDYLAAVEHSEGVTRKQYQREGLKINEVQRGILATSQNEEPFDVFICYKESDENGERTVDSTLAQDIYYQLIDQGYRVFFARITLEDKAGAEYEPYIFAALHSAKVMVVVGTKPEHFGAVWVKNEWSRFISLMKKDRRKLILPCYRDMDPYDLPEQLSVLQSYDMSKIGFMQDLIRGIGKVLDAEKEPEPVKENVVVQQAGGSNVDALLKRGYMALEDGEWDKADGFFEEVLNQDAENGKAYLGKFLAEQKAPSLDQLAKCRLQKADYRKTTNLKAGKRDLEREHKIYADTRIEGYLEKDKIYGQLTYNFSYQSTLASEREHLKEEQNWLKGERNFSRAKQYADPDTRTLLTTFEQCYIGKLKERVDNAETADQKRQKKCMEGYRAHLDQKEKSLAEQSVAAAMKKSEDYQAAVSMAESANTVEAFEDAENELKKFPNYKDAEKRAEWCRSEINRLQAEEEERKEQVRKAEAEEQRRQHEQEEKQRRKAIQKRKKIAIAAVCIVGAVAVGVLAIDKVVIPHLRYQNMLDLREQDTISAGYHYSVGVRTDGTVVKSGSNNKGQANVLKWKNIDAISACDGHTVGLRTDGTVVATEYTGQYYLGQCEVRDWEHIVQISVDANNTVGLQANGKVLAIGQNNNGECNVSNWENIVAISAGGYHTVGLKDDFTAIATGRNYYGQCNVSDWADIISIGAGKNHTIGLRADGTVVGVGDNSYGQCNVSDWKNITQISVGDNYTVGVTASGAVFSTGDNEAGQCNVSEWADIISISAGIDHTIGIKADGTVVATDYLGREKNNWNQCNISDWTNIKMPNNS